jgi:hypothetical protein
VKRAREHAEPSQRRTRNRLASTPRERNEIVVVRICHPSRRLTHDHHEVCDSSDGSEVFLSFGRHDPLSNPWVRQCTFELGKKLFRGD